MLSGGERGCVVKFGETFSCNEYKMIRMTPALAKMLCRSSAGESKPSSCFGNNNTALRGLEIKGDYRNQNAVVCTSDETFDLRKQESTNAQLLLSPCSLSALNETKAGGGRTVHLAGSTTFHFEPTKCVPRLDQLRALMKECEFDDQDSENGASKAGYTTTQLRERVQASDAEIASGLETIGAFQVEEAKGKPWRVLRDSYARSAFDMVMSVIVGESMPLDAVSEGAIVACLSGDYPPFVVRHVLKSHSSARSESNADTLWTLDPVRVARAKATHMLSSENVSAVMCIKTQKMVQVVAVGAFVSAWKDSLPPGLPQVDLDMRGIAIKREINSRMCYIPVRDNDLPLDAAKRFAHLFAISSRWTMEELSPYMVAVAGKETKQQEKMLRKYARFARGADGSRYFCKR